MSGLPHLHYQRPDRLPRATAWARDWRRRWFREVGTVVQHIKTGGLQAIYADNRDPSSRIALQRELEQTTKGPALVIAACREATRNWERKMLG